MMLPQLISILRRAILETPADYFHLTCPWPPLSETESRKCILVSVLLVGFPLLREEGGILGRQHTHSIASLRYLFRWDGRRIVMECFKCMKSLWIPSSLVHAVWLTESQRERGGERKRTLRKGLDIFSSTEISSWDCLLFSVPWVLILRHDSSSALLTWFESSPFNSLDYFFPWGVVGLKGNKYLSSLFTSQMCLSFFSFWDLRRDWVEPMFNFLGIH